MKSNNIFIKKHNTIITCHIFDNGIDGALLYCESIINYFDRLSIGAFKKNSLKTLQEHFNHAKRCADKMANINRLLLRSSESRKYYNFEFVFSIFTNEFVVFIPFIEESKTVQTNSCSIILSSNSCICRTDITDFEFNGIKIPY